MPRTLAFLTALAAPFVAHAADPGKVEIIAHRGASHDAPENTLAAVKLAWEQGADAVEFDIYLTKDGRVAVIHDKDTKRTAGSPGLVVADTPLADLRALDVGKWKARTPRGSRRNAVCPTRPASATDVPQSRRLAAGEPYPRPGAA